MANVIGTKALPNEPVPPVMRIDEAKGCIRSCMEFQEKTKNIGQHSFETPVFPGPKWELPPPESDETGGIVEKKKLTELFQDPDLDAGQWK